MPLHSSSIDLEATPCTNSREYHQYRIETYMGNFTSPELCQSMSQWFRPVDWTFLGFDRCCTARKFRDRIWKVFGVLEPCMVWFCWEIVCIHGRHKYIYYEIGDRIKPTVAENHRHSDKKMFLFKAQAIGSRSWQFSAQQRSFGAYP